MFPKIYINKFIFSDKVQFGFSEATASSSHLQILPLLCVIEESPSLKMYGHKLWQSPAVGRAGRAKFGSLDQTDSKTIYFWEAEKLKHLQKSWSFFHLHAWAHRVVSIINSRIFTIISTINQRQPAMEKIFQDNYSKSWYSNAAVHGKDEQWFEC